MPVQGIDKVRSALNKKFSTIRGQKSAEALYVILSQGAGAAQTHTPIDTSNLVNSQTAPEMTPTTKGIKGRIMYTAEYAAAVHAAKGTLRGEDRPDGRGQYWDPGGDPEFLSEGFEDIKPAIPAILNKVYGDV